MREVELKSIVADAEAVQARARAAGARAIFTGALYDRRYDTPDRALTARDHVLRLRVRSGPEGSQAWLDWKGPTRYEDGYKIREEVSAPIDDHSRLATLLERLGYVVTREIEREVSEYELAGATVRFERYPRMDDLVEVEGEPEAIETAVSALGMQRAGFTAERLPDFARRFEERTGTRAALCGCELAGDYPYDLEDS